MLTLKNINQRLLHAIDSIINSYAVVFFSNNRFFGILLLLASFVDPIAGGCGLLGLVSANVFASVLGLNTDFIRKGYHGYDAMLVSIGIAHFYQFNITLLIVIICVGIFSILIASGITSLIC